jgi:hypothetical protein
MLRSTSKVLGPGLEEGRALIGVLAMGARCSTGGWGSVPRSSVGNSIKVIVVGRALAVIVVAVVLVGVEVQLDWRVSKGATAVQRDRFLPLQPCTQSIFLIICP